MESASIVEVHAEAKGSNNEKVAENVVSTGCVTYREVITWLKPFDGSAAQYPRFASDCERCFGMIDQKDFGKLLNYVWTLLDDKFLHLRSTDFTSWSQLRKALDEFYGIRQDEKGLFRELTSIKKNPAEDLYAFYNRLHTKCMEYRKLLFASNEKKDLLESRMRHAEEYALESFIMSVGMNFRPLIMDKNPKNLQEAYTLLRNLEMGTGSKSSDSVEDKLSEMLQLMKMNNISAGGNISSPQINRVEEVNKSNRVQCQICDKFGHKALKCFKLKDLMGNQNGEHNWIHNFTGAPAPAGSNFNYFQPNQGNGSNMFQGDNNGQWGYNNWQGENNNWQGGNNNWQGKWGNIPLQNNNQQNCNEGNQ